MMGIKVIDINETKIFNIETENTSYVIKIIEGYPNNVYWGKKLLHPEELASPRFCTNASVFRGDKYRQNDEYPAFGGLFYGNESLKITFSDNVRETVIKYSGYEISEDKMQLIITLKDTVYPLTVLLKYKIYDGIDIIDRSSEIINNAKEPITLETFDSASWSLPYNERYRLTYMSSSVLHEYEIKTCDLGQNTTVLESKSGKSNTQNYPYFAVDDYSATESAGDVWFGSLQWSGNWKIKAGKDDVRNARITGGISDFDCNIYLEGGEKFATPIFSGGFVTGGFGAASRQFHDYQRATTLNKFTDKVMPMLYCVWSSFHFDFDEKLLADQAKLCADLGCELFLVDDGWFGQRNDDTSSLGDWYPSKEKFPNGFKATIDYINSIGLKFGLWIEPEMVNRKSNLFKNHPDWIMNYPTRENVEVRHQITLNFAREDVYKYIEQQIDTLLSENNIEFLKFDMNRFLSQAGWPENDKNHQKMIWIKYVQNFYRLLDFINKNHPNVMVENCAEGGTRSDLSMAKWCARNNRSDNQDPVDVLQLHQGFTRVLLTKAAGGCTHLHHTPNFVNGRSATYKFMAYVGFNGSFSCGLDLKRLSPEELEEIASYIKIYKSIRETVQLGDMYVLKSAFDKEGRTVQFQYVSKDKTKSVILVYSNNNGFVNWIPPIIPQGLEPEYEYKLKLHGTEKFKLADKISGDTAMKYGISNVSGFMGLSDVVYDAFAIVLEKTEA